jgi:hypothetical protein
MPRPHEIRAAFIEAIQLNPKGYLYLSTESFIARLREKNWHFSRLMLTSGLNIISQTMPTRPLTAAKTATGSCATWRGYCDGIFSKLSSDIRDGAKLRCPLCARSGPLVVVSRTIFEQNETAFKYDRFLYNTLLNPGPKGATDPQMKGCTRSSYAYSSTE